MLNQLYGQVRGLGLSSPTSVPTLSSTSGSGGSTLSQTLFRYPGGGGTRTGRQSDPVRVSTPVSTSSRRPVAKPVAAPSTNSDLIAALTQMMQWQQQSYTPAPQAPASIPITTNVIYGGNGQAQRTEANSTGSTLGGNEQNNYPYNNGYSQQQSSPFSGQNNFMGAAGAGANSSLFKMI